MQRLFLVLRLTLPLSLSLSLHLDLSQLFSLLLGKLFPQRNHLRRLIFLRLSTRRLLNRNLLNILSYCPSMRFSIPLHEPTGSRIYQFLAIFP
jgi:hypothetical protein